jgi:signal transduction histidine kinase
VTAAATSCGILARERGLSVSTDLPPSPVTIVGDRDRLHQVFMNLLVNAIKFTEQGGIRISLTDHADAAQIDIADTGRGIPPEDLERIFDKFERVGPAHQDGSGLGLPIARGIVELHHGRIWVESTIGQGSRFIVRLPHSP